MMVEYLYEELDLEKVDFMEIISKNGEELFDVEVLCGVHE